MNPQLNIPYSPDDPLDHIIEELKVCDMPYSQKEKIVVLIKRERYIKVNLETEITNLQFRLEEANKRLLESTIVAQAGYFEYLTGGTEAENKAAEQRLQSVCHCAPKVIAQVIGDLQHERIIAENLQNLSLFVRRFNSHYHTDLKFGAFYSAFFTNKTKMRQKFSR